MSGASSRHLEVRAFPLGVGFHREYIRIQFGDSLGIVQDPADWCFLVPEYNACRNPAPGKNPRLDFSRTFRRA